MCHRQKTEVKRWRHDFWLKIIEAVREGRPDCMAPDWHPALSQRAALFGIEPAKLLAWLDNWNKGELYEEQLRPVGFVLAYWRERAHSPHIA